MKLQKHESLLVAERVVSQLRKIWPAEWEGRVGAWANGREQGLSISIYQNRLLKGHVRVNIAQTRNGESILFIVAPAKEFDGRTNDPSESAWETGSSVDAGEYEQAAKEIARQVPLCFNPTSK